MKIDLEKLSLSELHVFHNTLAAAVRDRNKAMDLAPKRVGAKGIRAEALMLNYLRETVAQEITCRYQ